MQLRGMTEWVASYSYSSSNAVGGLLFSTLMGFSYTAAAAITKSWKLFFKQLAV